MAIEITLAESGNYQIVRVSESVSAEIARELAVRTEAFMAQTGVQNRLFDLRGTENVAAVSQNYDLAYKDLDEMGIDRGIKSAILVDPEDESHDFAVLVLRNAGFNARKFVDEPTAVAWLEDDRPR
jgi:hypothetical protein